MNQSSSEGSTDDFFTALRLGEFIIEPGETPDILFLSLDKTKLTMVELARRVLEKSEKPLRPSEIISRAREIFGSHIGLPSKHSLANLPGYYRDFYLLDRKTIGLRQHFRLPEEKWDIVKNDFYQLLAETKRPFSTSEVIVGNLYEWTGQTTPSEAAEILREDKRFKDLGRFLFSLAEWQIEEREPIKELVVKVLREANTPLTAAEIGQEIQKYRSAFTAALASMLNQHEEIRKYKFGYYGLKEWDKDFQEFFITNAGLVYRAVKRTKPITFGELCEEFEISFESQMAHKLWRTLRSLDNLRFEPVYKSPETKISRVYW